MRRWGAPLIAVLLACVAIVASRSSSPALLQDTDTQVLLAAIEERDGPLTWFAGDWPLRNHFYRPVSTLTFELDRALFGRNASGYGLSAGLWCALTTLSLFWLLRELTDLPWLSAASAIVFAAWHLPTQPEWTPWAALLAVLVTAAGVGRHRGRLGLYVPAVLMLFYLAAELHGAQAAAVGEVFHAGVLTWLPARTATTMACFAIASMAAYARAVTLSAGRTDCTLSPLDLPATRSSRATGRKGRPAGWLALAFLSAALALGCYEQAAMLPLVMIGVGLILRRRGYRVAWGWHAGFWLLLLAYLIVRSQVLPPSVSTYQQQQLRAGVGSTMALTAYVMPSLALIPLWWQGLHGGWPLMLTAHPYRFPFAFAANATGLWQIVYRKPLALGFWALSIVAFLPMAWLKPFPHYHYWPLAIRSAFVAYLAWAAWDLCVIAGSPPATQAPPRPSPAPGSLPRR